MYFSRLLTLLLSLLCLLDVGASYAADVNREYRVRAYSRVESCAALNRAVIAAKQEDDWRALYGFSLYMQGYLSALNRLSYDTYDIVGKANSKTILVWLEDYCEANPNDSFDAALVKMSAEFYPNRYTIKPR